MKRILMALLLACAAGLAEAQALPSDSVYQLPVTLTDQQGRSRPLSAFRGRPLLVSMFYTNCEFVCPMLVEALSDTLARLGPQERAQVAVLLVSFDPERDTVAVLRQTAEQRRLDPAHWTLARTDARSVRQLAAVLGIQYRAEAKGEFKHSTALILLDADGRIAARTHRLADADPAFVARVSALARAVDVLSVPR
jgi:protein SCO1